MIRRIDGSTEADRLDIWKWCVERWPVEDDIPMPHDFKAMYYRQFNDDGTIEVLAVVGFTDWTEAHCQLHIASDKTRRWFTPEFIYEVYNFLFRTMGRTRISGVAHHDNPNAVRLHEKLGHHLDCELHHFGGKGKHANLYSMTFEDWQTSKWNKDRSEAPPN